MKIFQFLDWVFLQFLQRFLYLIPDVGRFDLTTYVVEGFDIPFGQLMTDNLIPLVAYVLPWIILSFYLMKSREIAA